MRSCWHTAVLPEEKVELKDFLKGKEMCGNKQHMWPANKSNQWHRHAPRMGTKMENRDNSRKPEQSLQQKKGKKITFIKYLYRFALCVCETKGNALMFSFQDHLMHPGNHCNCYPHVPLKQLMLCLLFTLKRSSFLVSWQKKRGGMLIQMMDKKKFIWKSSSVYYC